MESLTAKNCMEFTAALAAKAPVPGGGGASALTASLGAALCTMVGNYTVGKAKYAAVEDDVRKIMDEAERLRVQLLELVDEDAAAFEPLSRAYGMDKDDPTRDAVMEECLRNAARPPMEILRLACRAIELHEAMLEKGSVLMVSDVGTGVVLCWSALYGAALNVRVNTKLMKDRAYADEMNDEVDRLMNQYWKIADQVYENVYGRFC